MFALRIQMRDREVVGRVNEDVLEQAGLSQHEVDEMYRYLALADYEDRFVIPTSHREVSENAYEIRGGCGFSFGNGCSGGGRTEPSLFGSPKKAGHVPVPGKQRRVA
jgi:nitrate reductase beta subunit